jgi:UDP-2,4-diacetamido-2,4,6-trideoxy-beta-L-altropyranose hydrolase
MSNIMLNVAFRVDSSTEMGIGHLMRCLTLAKAIKNKYKAGMYFFTRASQGNINHLITPAGCKLIEMSPHKRVTTTPLQHSQWLGASQDEDAKEFISLTNKLNITSYDLLIIDHYAIDVEWETLVAPKADKLFVIDDLGDRKHKCDYLLDQTFNCSAAKYQDLVPSQCTFMLGTRYALLRDEFQISTNDIINTRDAIMGNTILIMFGGTDPDNLSLIALKIVTSRDDVNIINIIMGPSALHLKSISEYCKNDNRIRLHVSPNNIAELMLTSTLAVGAAGTTSWERCAMGLPSVVVIQADNQRQIGRELETEGVLTVLEIHEMKKGLHNAIDHWLSTGVISEFDITLCTQICDGLGSNRTIQKVFHNV